MEKRIKMKKKLIFLTSMMAFVLSLMMVLGSCAMLQRPGDMFVYDAGNLRNVMRISDDSIPKSWLSVSFDGQQLLYAEQESNFDPDRNTNFNTSRIIYLRNAMVFTKTPLVDSYNFAPAWYENGQNFVYITRNQNNTTQLVRSSVTGGRTFITRNPISNGGWDNNPSIRNDIIALDAFINNQRQIVTVRDNGSELTVLGRGMQPSWHPTENKLVFIRDGGIWEMNTENAQVTQLLAVSTDDQRNGLVCRRPSYSRDGNWIIFTRWVRVGNRTFQHLFVMDAEGNRRTELAGGNVNIWSPAWGAGNEVFFISNAGNRDEIWSALVTMH
ncbi:MAG: hypothetical protein LBC80_00690 [Treponema sp.]|jgi:TolB protein|nr:hypothetical protein [Treponema sp.]